MTQIDAIRSHLLRGKSITPIQALRLYGCFRLAAVIFDIRAEGYIIDTEMVSNGKGHFAEYTLTAYAPRV